MYQKRNEKGFTIMELIVTLALFFLFVGGLVTISNNYLVIQQLDNAVNILIEEVRRAQGDALAGTGDIGHGIRLEGETIVRFRGSDYLTRDTNYDVTSVFPAFVSFTGDNEVVFNKNTSFPDQNSVIYISNGFEQYTLTISGYGNISITRGAITP